MFGAVEACYAALAQVQVELAHVLERHWRGLDVVQASEGGVWGFGGLGGVGVEFEPAGVDWLEVGWVGFGLAGLGVLGV